MVCPIVTGSFREWLRDTLETQGVSRRELARRLPGDPESNRRTLRRILSGETNPTDRTREEIEAALGDHSAPSRGDELDGLRELVVTPDFLDALRPLVKALQERRAYA
jgi:transcriptional regulator with XRE-family HTH domain